MNPQDTQSPVPQTAAVGAQQAPIFNDLCYLIPSSSHTTMGAQQARVCVYPGLLIELDLATGQELRRVQLTPDLVLEAPLGMVYFRQLNGQKYGLMDKTYLYYFYNPKLMIISYLFMLFGLSKAKQFAKACKIAAGTN